MKNIIVYLLAAVIVFVIVIGYKDAMHTKKRIGYVEKAITPKDEGFMPPVNSGWKIIGDIDGIQIYRKYDCLDHGVGCHWLYLTVGRSDRQFNFSVK